MRPTEDRCAQPPRLAEALLGRVLPAGGLGRSILGDLRQEFGEICAEGSSFAARRWYWRQTVSFGAHYLLVSKVARGTSQETALERGDGVMRALTQDLRYALRGMVRRPGFTTTVVALVALGVGATTTIFSVVDGVLLRELPYPDPEELVFFGNPSHPAPLFKDWRDRTSSFVTVGAAWDSRMDMTSEARPESVFGAGVTEDFFSMLGARARRGRLFASEDFVGFPSRVAVLSHGFWQRKWGSDPDAIGQTISLNGARAEIVGILSPSFHNPEALVGRQVDVWLPLDLSHESWDRRDRFSLGVVARLRPEIDLAMARTDVDALSAQLAEEYPEQHRRSDGSARTFPLVPFHEATTGEIDTALLVLFGAVGLMLLIACANVANLFLARGADRQREMALRAALGAGRTRIFGQLLTESVVLSLVGGVAGVGLAILGVRVFSAFEPGGIPRVDSIAVDVRVMLFAVSVSVATGVSFGMVPALQAARSHVIAGLRDAGGASTPGRSRTKLRGTLVVTEIALALMLLVGAGLLFNSFVRLTLVDPGIEAEGVIVMPMALPGSYPEARRITFVEDVVEAVATVPGVERAVAGATMPMAFGGGMCCYYTSIRPALEAEDGPRSIVHPTTTGYFSFLDIRLVRGRTFDTADRDPAAAPAIVNETLARELFGEGDALGATVHFADVEWTIVGIVEDIKHWGLTRSDENNLYVPHAIFGDQFRTLHVAVSSHMGTAALADGLRRAVWSIDPNLPVPEVSSLQSLISRSLAQPRFFSLLLTTFATLAILLAAGGIYGSMLYSVGQRSREMGIRMALGARQSRVVGMIVKTGLLQTLAGIGLGLVGAYGLSRYLESFLFGVTRTDPSTFAAVAVLLGAVAMVAAYLPARRAAATNPIETLRTE